MDAAMDLTAFKMMLESQERAFKLSLDTVVKEMHDHISKLENKISELTTSLEFTQREVDDLKSKAKDHDTERRDDKSKIENLTKQVNSSNITMKNLEDKVVYQEDYSRRKNLRINGLEENGNETWEQTSAAVTSLLETKLQLPGVVLERAHRVGPRRDSRPRTIVARFTRYGDRDAAIRRGRYLKGTNIFLNEDLSPTSQAIKNAQMPLFKQARAEGKIAFFRHTKLIIRERTNEDDTGRGQQSTEVTGAVGGGVPGGAQGGSGPVTGAADTAGGVVNVESAGVWIGKDDGHSTTSSPQPVGSRTASPAPAVRPGGSRTASPAVAPPRRTSTRSSKRN